MKVNLNGQQVEFDACVALMDDEIRELIHSQGVDNDQEFLDLYCMCHEIKYHEKFTV